MGTANEKVREINRSIMESVTLRHAGLKTRHVSEIMERGLDEYADEKLEEAAQRSDAHCVTSAIRSNSSGSRLCIGCVYCRFAKEVRDMKSTAPKECKQHDLAPIESNCGDIICTLCKARWTPIMG